MTQNLRHTLLMIGIASCGMSHLTTADTIALRSSVRLAAGAESVTLSDIADLDGPDAMSFADLMIAQVTDSSAVMELSIRDVRGKLDDAGAHWGRINLSGRKVLVRRPREADASVPLAMTAASIEIIASAQSTSAPSHDEYVAADVLASPTLRGLIASLMASNLHLDPAQLRLSFQAADHATLDQRTDTTQFEIQSLGSFSSDRVELTVRTWSQNKVQDSRSVAVRPTIRVQAATLKRNIQPNETINDDDLEMTEQWLPPSQAALATTRITAIGRVASKALKAGELLREKHVHRDALIKRGDITMVRCLVGGVAISLQAEARADGFQGDTIEFRKQGEREAFLATVTGRGEAIVDLSRK